MGLMCLQVRRSETEFAVNGMNVGQLDGEETGPANRKLCGSNHAEKKHGWCRGRFSTGY